MFNRLKGDINNLIDEAIYLSYFMRGAITYDIVLLRTPGERQKIAQFVDKRLDSQSKKTFPVF